jgi:hypothetical protein
VFHYLFPLLLEVVTNTWKNRFPQNQRCSTDKKILAGFRNISSAFLEISFTKSFLKPFFDLAVLIVATNQSAHQSLFSCEMGKNDFWTKRAGG